jgi:acyl carrier protein
LSQTERKTSPTSPNPAAIRASLRTYLVDACFDGQSPAGFSDTDDLIELGLMDSLTLMGLATYIEQQFGIQLGGNDLVPAHFQSIDALANLVTSRLSVR